MVNVKCNDGTDSPSPSTVTVHDSAVTLSCCTVTVTCDAPSPCWNCVLEIQWYRKYHNGTISFINEGLWSLPINVIEPQEVYICDVTCLFCYPDDSSDPIKDPDWCEDECNMYFARSEVTFNLTKGNVYMCTVYECH